MLKTKQMLQWGNITGSFTKATDQSWNNWSNKIK
jgi:hypothetical protein